MPAGSGRAGRAQRGPPDELPRAPRAKESPRPPGSPTRYPTRRPVVTSRWGRESGPAREPFTRTGGAATMNKPCGKLGALLLACAPAVLAGGKDARKVEYSVPSLRKNLREGKDP